MISIYKTLYEINPALVQAGIWGASSALTSKLTEDPAKKREEKIKNLKKMGISGALGAAAGAAGHYLS